MLRQLRCHVDPFLGVENLGQHLRRRHVRADGLAVLNESTGAGIDGHRTCEGEIAGSIGVNERDQPRAPLIAFTGRS